MELRYRRIRGYKYQTLENYTCPTGIITGKRRAVKDSWVKLDPTGEIHILKGYAWDGASGPTVDSKSSMFASLVHDALYQLMREEQLDRKYRKSVDDLFYNHCIECGMNKKRAKLWYWAVRWFGESATRKVDYDARP